MERHYYEELMTLARGIYHWAESEKKQNGSAQDIKKCLYEMRSRCSQASNLALLCENGIIEELQMKGE
ncbi:MAG: hypothetical protein J6W06_10345 [Bacteroidales bacterium]|nr:hypothetical protein [Bacteroidales bacterium]